MVKKKLQEELQRGLEKLRAQGVAVDEPSADLLGLLKGFLGKDRDTDLAVIFLLGGILDRAALESLIALEASATDKEVKKEARRSIFRLAQKGISAPRAEAPEPRAPVFKLAPGIEAYSSSVDSGGGRLLWLARPQAGTGIHLLQAMVSDREGLLRVGGLVVRRRELRRMAQEIKEKHGITMISIPWEYADQVLYEAYEKAKALGRGGIEDFPSLRAIFNPSRPEAIPHPIYSRLSRDEVRSGAWRELSRGLLDLPEFRLWILDEDWLKPYLEQVGDAEQSRIVLSQAQKAERVQAIIRDAARESFSGDGGKLFQGRMEDMALYLLATEREKEAKLALAVAVAIEEGDLGGLGALEISFLNALLEKSLKFYRGQAKSEEEPSLIVKP